MNKTTLIILTFLFVCCHTKPSFNLHQTCSSAYLIANQTCDSLHHKRPFKEDLRMVITETSIAWEQEINVGDSVYSVRVDFDTNQVFQNVDIKVTKIVESQLDSLLNSMKGL